MRQFLIPLAAATATALMSLSGCAGWVVFGHTIQGPQPATSVNPPASATQPGAPAAQAPLATQPAAPPPASPLPSAPAASPAAPLFKSITLTFTPAAQQKLATEPQFQQATLLTTIESELRAHKLLDANDPRASGTARISINDFATRPATNAVVFGYVLGTGTLSGNIDVPAAEGNAPRDAHISAESRLAKSVNGGQANPFGPLYHRFAAATVDSLTGTTATHAEPHWGQDRPPP